MNNDTSAKRDAWFKEYQTLRQESLQTMANRTQIISFGLGTVGVLVAGTIAASAPSPHLVSTMFDVAIPLVSVLLYYAWFAEFERMVRAGRFIQRLEHRINETLGNEPVLSWEKYLETARMGYAYVVVAILFLGIATLAPYAGLWVQQGAGTPAEGLLKLPAGLSLGDLLAESRIAWAAALFAFLHIGYRYVWVLPKYRP